MSANKNIPNDNVKTSGNKNYTNQSLKEKDKNNK